MSGYLRPLLGALFLVPAPLAAEPYTYADFEASVPHVDLETCPNGATADLARGREVFCRVSLNNDALHVYVFDAGGMQEFVALHTYFEEEFSLRLGE